MKVLTEKLLLTQGSPAEYTAYLLSCGHLTPGQKRPAVVICPGGGYEHLADREGEAVAMQYLAMGCHAFVLKYSLAPHRFPAALRELAFLVATIRQHEEEWQIDGEKIIVSGFSAGGHLACSLGVFWNRELAYGPLGLTKEQIRPDGLILGYPVITAGPWCHEDSVRNLLGEGADDEEKRNLVSLELQVGPHMPKTFLWHTVTDSSVPVQNSLLLVDAMVKNHVNLEFHLYPVGGHGLALATGETAKGQACYVEPQCQSWVSLAKCWIENL